MPGRRTLPTVGMGSEGMPWVAAQSFVDTPHMFQNLGDGTFAHSGVLTIRAAVAAKSNVTYKILYNDAVAMTGGQPAEGSMTPLQIVRELLAEGVAPVVLVTEDTSQYDEPGIPAGVEVLDRDDLDAVQRRLRDLPGVSAIVYEQTCANEKRRRRKRGTLADPDRRLFINTAVCEGCGDCSVQSNCLSVVPVETEFGRKRGIDQSTCNKDFSCIKGFCPSFVEVSGVSLAKRELDTDALAALVAKLHEPPVASLPQAMLVTGIGGTGVLTVGAILAMAAHLEGKAAKVLDQTGMAQKGGAVTSHVRIGADAEAIPSARLGAGQADTVIACDLVVAAGPEVLALARADSCVLANDDVAPTGEFQANRELDLGAARFLGAIGQRVDPAGIATLRAGTLAERLLGDTIFTNLTMLGFAAQHGHLPVSVAAVEQAIRLNGIAVASNLSAFALGRVAAVDPDALFALADAPAHGTALPRTLAEIVASRSGLLTLWQDGDWAADYRGFIEEFAGTLHSREIAGGEALLAAAARELGRLMAYKDEYEVARLYSDPAFAAALGDRFAGEPRLKVYLAPPILAWWKDLRTGRPRKIGFGGWVFGLFRLLARMKRLRGTPFDPFGHTEERRMERALIGEYRELMRLVAATVRADTLPVAVEIAAAAGLVCGYGPVKQAGVAAYRARVAELMAQLEA
jgi:indolepyruvate ferredoxin oxidoreductase